MPANSVAILGPPDEFTAQSMFRGTVEKRIR